MNHRSALGVCGGFFCCNFMQEIEDNGGIVINRSLLKIGLEKYL